MMMNQFCERNWKLSSPSKIEQNFWDSHGYNHNWPTIYINWIYVPLLSVTPCTYTKYSSVRVLTRHVSFMRICNCHIFRIMPHFSHNISAKCVHRIFFPHKLAFSTAILILIVFLLPISVEWAGVVGFKQFCIIFLPHIWCLCGPHIFLKMPHKTVMPNYLPCVPKKVSPLTFCNNNRKSAPI